MTLEYTEFADAQGIAIGELGGSDDDVSSIDAFRQIVITRTWFVNDVAEGKFSSVVVGDAVGAPFHLTCCEQTRRNACWRNVEEAFYAAIFA